MLDRRSFIRGLMLSPAVLALPKAEAKADKLSLSNGRRVKIVPVKGIFDEEFGVRNYYCTWYSEDDNKTYHIHYPSGRVEEYHLKRISYIRHSPW